MDGRGRKEMGQLSLRVIDEVKISGSTTSTGVVEGAIL